MRGVRGKVAFVAGGGYPVRAPAGARRVAH
jgi:hypothetical protein